MDASINVSAGSQATMFSLLPGGRFLGTQRAQPADAKDHAGNEKGVCGPEMRRTACQSLPLQSRNGPLAAATVYFEFNESGCVASVGSLTAACSTVELLRNGSLEF